MDQETQLKRTLSLPIVIFFGLGTILGAGIYVLVGKIAGHAGTFTPISFMVSSVLAILTALSYAEFSSRYPKSAGGAVFVHASFKWKELSLIIGLFIALSGIVSTGVLSKGFSAYLNVFFKVDPIISTILIILIMGIIAFIGINLSSWLIGVITAIEVLGLIYILWVARNQISLKIISEIDLIPNLSGDVWSGIIIGAFLAFYAYIGFEDMANIAEEVKNPEKNLPRAIILSIVVGTILYMLVSIVTILSLPINELKNSNAPLALLYEKSTGEKAIIISLISLFAVVNGAIVQIIMASRLLYGMSQEKWLPSFLGKVYPKTQTPLNSTILVVIITIILAVSIQIEELANITNFLLLSVFSLINLSLVRVKLKNPNQKAPFNIPIWVPISGFISSFAIILYKIITLF